jgi:hypothetical protein
MDQHGPLEPGMRGNRGRHDYVSCSMYKRTVLGHRESVEDDPDPTRVTSAHASAVCAQRDSAASLLL